MTKWKADNGNWYSKSLFIELCPLQDRDLAMYSTKDEDQEVDGKVYPSLYKLYMEMQDIHEVTFAKKYLGGYKHLKTLEDLSPWFKVMINEWREELELVLMTMGFDRIKQNLVNDERGSLISAKYFLDRSWDSGIHAKADVKRGRGRPTKTTLQQAVLEKSTPSTVVEDYKRLFNNRSN